MATFQILYRDMSSKVPTRTLVEVDDYAQATAILSAVVLAPEGVELIDYSPNLDGSIDDTLRRLDSVKVATPVGA